jgi:hypothetical protein
MIPVAVTAAVLRRCGTPAVRIKLCAESKSVELLPVSRSNNDAPFRSFTSSIDGPTYDTSLRSERARSGDGWCRSARLHTRTSPSCIVVSEAPSLDTVAATSRGPPRGRKLHPERRSSATASYPAVATTTMSPSAEKSMSQLARGAPRTASTSWRDGNAHTVAVRRAPVLLAGQVTRRAPLGANAYVEIGSSGVSSISPASRSSSMSRPSAYCPPSHRPSAE